MHLPLPAKIRSELLEPIPVDTAPERADEGAYVEAVHREVEQAIQAGMDLLTKRRRFPVFGQSAGNGAGAPGCSVAESGETLPEHPSGRWP